MTIQIYDTTLRDGTQRKEVSLSCDDKLRIETIIENLRAAIKENNLSEIERLSEELQQASYAISEKAYKETAGSAGSEGSPADAGSAPPPSDDVIDAEFKQ